MLPVDIYPDAEAALITYLMPALADEWSDVTIDARGAGARFVRVRRVGGIDATPAHDQPMLDVLVWHDTDAKRMALARRLWAWARAANNDRAGDAVITYQSTTLGPRHLPDPADQTKTVCAFTVTLLVRATQDAA